MLPIRRLRSAAPLKRLTSQCAALDREAAIRRLRSAAPLKPQLRGRLGGLGTAYPSTPVGGPIEAAAIPATNRNGDSYPSTPVGGPIEAVPPQESPRDATNYPSTPVGGPIEAARVAAELCAQPAYPSTPVGGPIEASRGDCPASRAHGLSIRRLRSAAPLKHGGQVPIDFEHASIRRLRSAAPLKRDKRGALEAFQHRLSVDSGRRPH